jgi:hypothetical protein
MGVPAGRQLDSTAGREAGTDERVESGLTTFLTVPPCVLLSVVICFHVFIILFLGLHITCIAFYHVL